MNMDGEVLNDAWQKASDYEEKILYADKIDSQYKFKQNNIYKDDP